LYDELVAFIKSMNGGKSKWWHLHQDNITIYFSRI
jgi:hypothetical protein